MRDWFYGDKREIVKWGTILAIAQRHSIWRVLQVAMYRPDREDHQLAFDCYSVSLPKVVVSHFRDLDHIQQLAEAGNLKIDVHKDTFQWSSGFRSREDFRRAYFDKVTCSDLPPVIDTTPELGCHCQ